MTCPVCGKYRCIESGFQPGCIESPKEAARRLGLCTPAKPGETWQTATPAQRAVLWSAAIVLACIVGGLLVALIATLISHGGKL